MTGSSWQDVDRNDLGSLLGGAGYTNCYPQPQYEGKVSPSHGNHYTQITKYMTSATTITFTDFIDLIRSTVCVVVLKPHTLSPCFRGLSLFGLFTKLFNFILNFFSSLC